MTESNLSCVLLFGKKKKKERKLRQAVQDLYGGSHPDSDFLFHHSSVWPPSSVYFMIQDDCKSSHQYSSLEDGRTKTAKSFINLVELAILKRCFGNVTYNHPHLASDTNKRLHLVSRKTRKCHLYSKNQLRPVYEFLVVNQQPLTERTCEIEIQN